MGGLLKERPTASYSQCLGRPGSGWRHRKGRWQVVMEGGHLRPGLEHGPLRRGGQGGGLVSRYRLRWADLLHNPGVLPRWVSVGEVIQSAKNGVVDAERFEALSGTVSLPFPVGENRLAGPVKVIDPRGNEVMRVMGLGNEST